MDKVITSACVLLVALLVAETFDIATAASAPASAQQNKAAWVATQFIKGDETYRFDGMPGSIKVIPAQGTATIMGFNKPSGAPAYTFKASFNCRHAGFGNRVGKMLAYAIAPHTALITVKNKKVISATLDGKWNMLTEKPL